MKIVLTIPSFVPHGGIRVILEWANRLSKTGNEVSLFCGKGASRPGWFNLSRSIKITPNERDLKGKDILIICSPHDIDLEKSKYAPKKKFIFLQMLEHLFSPGNHAFLEKCYRVYSSNLPKILISQWNIDYIETNYPDRGQIFYVGNGINTEDFPIEKVKKGATPTVLVEGWNALNPTKDVDRVAPKVAAMLKEEGCHILAYSQLAPVDYENVPDEFYALPSLERMNRLYHRAHILIKATRFDARSTSPLEAMTKGCVVVRGIDKGDDDLFHLDNCMKVPYDVQSVYEAAKRVLKEEDLRSKLAQSGYNYVQTYSWDFWMKEIEGILFS